jgi:hypothetical protein
MEPDRYLIATAQISLAMAGFAGVVAAYRNQTDDGWGTVERFWLRLLLFNSILPFSFSLIGIFILVADPLPAARWRLSSGVTAICLVPYAAMIVTNLRRLSPSSLRAAGSGFLVSRTLVSILIAVCLLQIWNLVFGSAFWPFFAAILALILGAIFQFARLVLTSHRPQADKVRDDISEEP